MRVTIEYEIDVHGPDAESKGRVESQRNDGSWCANNLIYELQALTEGRCLCALGPRFEFLGFVSDELKEHRS